MRKEIYETIKSRLAELTANDTSVQLHVGLWNEQLINIEEEMAMALPAVLVEFEPVQWAQRASSQSQTGRQRITLHILIDTMHEDVVEFLWGDSVPDIFEIADLVVDRLVGVGGTRFNRLMPVASELDHDFDQIIHLREAFECEVVRESKKLETTARNLILELKKSGNEKADR